MVDSTATLLRYHSMLRRNYMYTKFNNVTVVIIKGSLHDMVAMKRGWNPQYTIMKNSCSNHKNIIL